MVSSKVAYVAQRMITPLEQYGPAVLLVENGRISAIGRKSELSIPTDAQVVDFGNRIIAPGFVDIHIHGGMGVRASFGSDAVLKISTHLPSTGTTAWLPTVGAYNKTPKAIEEVAGVVEALRAQEKGAAIAGVHLEGPYLAPKNLAGDEEERPVPSVEDFRKLWEASQGYLRLMGIAPELDNALDVIAEMRRLNVVPAIAHSKISFEEFQTAVAAGLRHVTHTYNVMSGLHHRKPGIVGGALTNDQVTAELIADGYHVHPVAMDILFRCKGPEKVCLITDNTQWAGLPDGEYDNVIKIGGIVRRKGFDENVDHTLAGSVWPMNHCVANAAKVLGGNLRMAILMATLNPAQAVGLSRDKGSLEPGKDADFIVIDEQVNVYTAVVGGQVQYQA